MKGPDLIGLTGTNGSGKGEVAAYFQKKGYAYFSLSDLLREELQKRGEQVTRDNLIRIGNELRRNFGHDVLARRVMEKVRKASLPAVIDSIRHPAEVEYLRQQASFILIAVDASPEIRFNRVRRRGRDESASSLEEFLAKEREEMAGKGEAQQLQNCLAMADFYVWNDGPLEELHSQLERIG